MLGYLRNTAGGAATYNLGRTLLVPGLLLGVGVVGTPSVRYSDAFHHTHLGMIGPARRVGARQDWSLGSDSMKLEKIVIETERLAFPALAAGVGPAVVCWHGFPDHPATFEPLAERLVAAGRRVVAPFLRGHHPDTADAMAYADSLTLAADAAAVAGALSQDGGVDMIGHDIGAGMVARVAAAWPERLRRGVTMAVPPPATMGALLAEPAQQRRLFYMWLFQIPGVAETVLEANRDLVDFLWSTWSPGLDPGEHRARVHELYGDPRIVANTLRIYRGNFDRSLHDPSLADLASRTEAPATIPLLVLAGADDGCIAAEFFHEAERGLAPGSLVEIVPDAGHFMHLDRPDEIARLVLDWLGGSAASRSGDTGL